MIDSHCHLDHEPLFSNIENIIKRSKEAGITKILTISTTSDSFSKIIKIVDSDPIIYGTFGIHPHESETDTISKEIIINNVKLNKKIIGVGETGLDFFYNHSDKKKQIESFEKHIQASLSLDIPLIIHSRNAEDCTFEILNSYKDQNLKILMHCFTGSLSFAKKLLELNAYFSASGIITFKNSVELQDTFSKIPLEKLLIETDSPFLAPVPMRGKKNEPSFVKFTAEKLSEIKKVNLDLIKDIISKNFDKLFFSNVS
jgi:TatD DNase family protein